MVSKRANGLAASETLKITALAKEMKRAGKSVISLSAGEPDFKTPDYICDAAVKAIRDGHHGYTMNTGTPELREAIAAKLKRDNELVYTPEQIIVSNGAKQSVGFTLLATVDKGDEVIIPAPYWVSYPEMVKLAEGTPVVVKTAFEHQYKLTPEQLEAAITPKTKVLILCSPSNPTGSCYSKEELKALAAVLLKHPQIYVISDEIYEYIVFDDKHVSIGQAEPAIIPQLLLINGFSKGFAMTGWRLGYLAGPLDVVKAVSKIQSQETSAPSTISQMAGEVAYKESLDAVWAMRDSFKERRDFVVAALNEIPGVNCFNPGGAFYVFPEISTYLGSKTPSGQVIATSTDLVMYLLENYGIATVPGDAFGEPGGIRLSYAIAMNDLKDAVVRLREGLLSLQN
ncbi:MAG: pyridoxal phosphate-dependent aminotransferase [Bacteroidetes bacterium]|nr:pyridoxal phosphate-dependent aminotransferase [Bacteroidota bacterium]